MIGSGALCLCLFAGQVASATTGPDVLIARARGLGLSESPSWRALLHYEPRFFSGWKSTADAPIFFASPDGKTDPELELQATLRAFFEPASEDTEEVQHPQCRFRARYEWLSGVLDFAHGGPAPQPCPRFEWWKQRLKARSLTLVFAAAYLNNPASMFGHTFLRLDRDASAAADLLAYTVNFAATPDTNNPFSYSVRGLLGGFPGVYSTLPYYMKVKEYSSLEHRDMFEYELALDDDELARLVAHLWEMGWVHFDYYYLDENCSYQLLSLLEVARPSLRLTREFPLYAVPADTVRAVLEVPGLVRARRFRPSLYRTMEAQRARLDGEQAARALALAAGEAGPETLAGLPNDTQAAILDGALEKLRYQTKDEPDAEEKLRQRALLLARGRTGVAATPLAIEPAPAPETGHGTALVALGAGADRYAPFLSLTTRFALHDHLAGSDGYVDGSEIEFLKLALRVPIRTEQGFRPELDAFTLLQVLSLAPIEPWSFRVSWRLSTGVLSDRTRGCRGSHCLYYGLSGGPGLATDFGSERHLTLYAFADAGAGAGPAFRDHYRLSAGATGGLLISPFDSMRLAFEGSVNLALLGDAYDVSPWRANAVLSFDLVKDVELRLEALALVDHREGRVALYFYF